MRKDNELHRQALINVQIEESRGYYPFGYEDKHLLDVTDPQDYGVEPEWKHQDDAMKDNLI